MDVEFAAAQALLLSILAKRGETVKDKDLAKLVTWAREQGFLKSPLLIFMAEEWRDIGDRMWDHVISGGKDKKFLKPLGPVWRAVANALKAKRPPAQRPPAASNGPSPERAAPTAPPPRNCRPEPGLRADRHLSRLRPVLSTGQQGFQGYTEDHCPSAAVPAELQKLARGSPLGSRIAVSAPPEEGIRSQPAAATASTGAGAHPAGEQRGAAGRAALCPALPTPEPPPPAGLQHDPLPGSGDEESDSEADLFPAERHPVSTATPGQPAVTELGRGVGEAIQKLEGRRDRALNSVPIRAAQSVQQLVEHIPAGRSCAPAPPSAPLPHCTTAEGGPATERRWAGVIRDAVLEGEWQIAGALTRPVVQSPQGPRYEQHEWKVLQQAKKTVEENGIKSDAARMMLDWLFTADVNSPMDCANLARLLLTPSQVIIWQREWERLARVEAGRPRPQGDALYGINPDMITGSGAYGNMAAQLMYPLQLHYLSAQLARMAFNAVPDVRPRPSFAATRQGLTESYPQFVDRLWKALANQAEMSEEVKQSVFKLLAFENANPSMKHLLATLPIDAGVEEMLDLVSRAEQQRSEQVMAKAMAQAIQPIIQLLAAAVARIGGKDGGCNPGICFRCGQKGHYRRACRAKVWCERCQRGTHATTACKMTKNGKQSAKGRRAPTKVDDSGTHSSGMGPHQVARSVCKYSIRCLVCGRSSATYRASFD
ncbi:hypothetical protein CIB84_005025 [Bambusicola thoracicus]|uniref:CCHC-type domain-containing protein n=1 Tax=Bambusicola thoracicus TaxID=9083 RepID=A0A2P4T4C3_BAMTH|nr:hypothetical protein CIB84_005025 [Bambusicola thoracicus]